MIKTCLPVTPQGRIFTLRYMGRFGNSVQKYIDQWSHFGAKFNKGSPQIFDSSPGQYSYFDHCLWLNLMTVSCNQSIHFKMNCSLSGQFRIKVQFLNLIFEIKFWNHAFCGSPHLPLTPVRFWLTLTPSCGRSLWMPPFIPLGPFHKFKKMGERYNVEHFYGKLDWKSNLK